MQTYFSRESAVVDFLQHTETFIHEEKYNVYEIVILMNQLARHPNHSMLAAPTYSGSSSYESRLCLSS
jgi:hypothetical protein